MGNCLPTNTESGILCFLKFNVTVFAECVCSGRGVRVGTGRGEHIRYFARAVFTPQNSELAHTHSSSGVTQCSVSAPVSFADSGPGPVPGPDPGPVPGPVPGLGPASALAKGLMLIAAFVWFSIRLI